MNTRNDVVSNEASRINSFDPSGAQVIGEPLWGNGTSTPSEGGGGVIDRSTIDLEALTRATHEAGKYFYNDFDLLSWAVVFLGIGLYLLHQGKHFLVEARRANPALPSPAPGLWAALILSIVLIAMHMASAKMVFHNLVLPLLQNNSSISLFITLPALSFRIIAWASIPITIVAAYFFLMSGLAITGVDRTSTDHDDAHPRPSDINQSKVSAYLAVGGFIASVLAVTANVVKIIEFSR